jgi:hypothetical protein
MIQRLPEFESTSQVGNNNGSTNKRGDAHGFIDFFSGQTNLFAFAQVVLDAIITPEDQ